MKWDKHSYIINGERKFLVSGEIHYFRVPKSDWEKRLLLLKEAGGNCVATYIPLDPSRTGRGRYSFW